MTDKPPTRHEGPFFRTDHKRPDEERKPPDITWGPVPPGKALTRGPNLVPSAPDPDIAETARRVVGNCEWNDDGELEDGSLTSAIAAALQAERDRWTRHLEQGAVDPLKLLMAAEVAERRRAALEAKFLEFAEGAGMRPSALAQLRAIETARAGIAYDPAWDEPSTGARTPEHAEAFRREMEAEAAEVASRRDYRERG